MKDLDGRTAVITGAASGIGFAMAEAFGAKGMQLVLGDIEDQALDEAVASLSGRGYQAYGVRTDVTDFASVTALADAAETRFGKVHLVVNNAGVSITGPIWELALDDWRWVHDVNVWGVIHGIKSFVPRMMAHGEPAHVVNTASLAAFNGTGEHSPYCSSKAAVLSISQSLYSEMQGWMTGIGVSVVCPGMVDTQIHRSWRNRPEGDQPWSDREFADPAHMEGSNKFQGAGVPAADIAALTLDAVLADRFYVFNGERWTQFVRMQYDAALSGEAPPVQTWGKDLRRSVAGAGA